MKTGILVVLATLPLLLTSTEWPIAAQFKSQIMMAGESCKTIHLKRTHPLAVLSGSPNFVWTITNHGPASVVIRTKSDPAFSIVFKPQKNTANIFAGDRRFRYTIGLGTKGTKAKVEVCN